MISMDKKYQTRGGHKVRIYALDGAGIHPIQGAVKTDNGWVMATWFKDGRCTVSMETPSDLIEVPETVTKWMNVHDGWVGTSLSTRTAADNVAIPRIGVLRVEYTGDSFEVFKEE